MLLAGMTTLEPAWTRGPYEKQVRSWCTCCIQFSSMFRRVSRDLRLHVLRLAIGVLTIGCMATMAALQETTTGTPYQPLAVTLPNMMNHVHGVRKVLS